MRLRIPLWLAASAALLLGGVGVSRTQAAPRSDPAGRAVLPAPGRAPPDIDAVIRAGVLRVGLPRDRTSYLLDRGKAQGLELEVLQAFARDLGIRLEVVPLPTVHERYQALAAGRVDAVAGRLSYDPRYTAYARWSEPVATARLAVVTGPGLDAAQQAGNVRVAIPGDAPWRGLLAQGSLSRLAAVPLAAAPRTEDVLDRIAEGRLGAAVVREDLARLDAGRRPLAVHPLPATVGSRVAFSRGGDALRLRFDRWLAQHDDLVVRLRRRYLEDPRRWARVAMARPSISTYDAPLRLHADRVGLDWHLLAALAWQESRFRPWARSSSGAVGLMQLMPATAQEVGVTDRRDPVQNISGGATYLGWLDGLWAERIPDRAARLPFVLASYNAGAGHVEDARRLADAAGEDPDDWAVVAAWMLRLAEPEWAAHPLARHGGCKGVEPVQYVELVLEQWSHYRALGPA